ncbi:MAG TPA: hypothetical protein VI432_02210 [Candidatus Paceibacterota bacterium]
MPTPSQTQNIKETFVQEDLTAGLSWRLFIFLLIIFSTLLFGYWGMEFGYKSFLSNSISNLDEELKVLGAEVQSVDQKNLLAFYSQIVNIRTLLGSHIFSSKVFTLLESLTHDRVAYLSSSVSVQDRTLRLEALTNSYDTAVAQLDTYSRSPSIEKVTLGGIQFVNDVIRFEVDLTLKSEVFDVPPEASPVIQSVELDADASTDSESGSEEEVNINEDNINQ